MNFNYVISHGADGGTERTEILISYKLFNYFVFSVPPYLREKIKVNIEETKGFEI